MADGLQRENESLRQQLADLLKKADDVVAAVEDGVELGIQSDTLSLTLGGESVSLLEPSGENSAITYPNCGFRMS